MALSAGLEKCWRPKCERGALNQSVLDHVHAHQLNASRPFRKSSCDIFVVNHDVAENFSPNQPGVEVGLIETLRSPGPDLCVSFGKQLAAQFKLLCIW